MNLLYLSQVFSSFRCLKRLDIIVELVCIRGRKNFRIEEWKEVVEMASRRRNLRISGEIQIGKYIFKEDALKG